MTALRIDPQRSVAAVRRALEDAPARVAELFARAVRDAPDERLEQAMSSPLRRVVLEAIFWQMPRHVDRAQSRALKCSVRWKITGRGDGNADVYQLEFADGSCRTTRGSDGSEPRLTITLDAVEFLRLATGNADPMRSYFGGDVMLAGDIMLAAKLSTLFRIPGSSASGSPSQPRPAATASE